ncbi:hypothetical protein [Streptomyces wedmorensis]|uniref:hypothetical protein n=1 Tax=Streptomyces wedmorensis TaxID=43759 RepID=UPI0037AB8111
MSEAVIRVRGVNDASRPRPAVDDLARLVPAVVPREGADAELVVIGERYWAFAGFAPELGTPVWCERAKDIDTAGWGHQVYAVAAAGVRAVVAGRLCPQCGGPLSLTSRAAFQQVCDGYAPVCVDCNESLTAAVRVIVDPARKAKREAAKAKAEERNAVDSAHARWKQLQREAVAEEYAAVFPSKTEVPASGVREMVGALALLRYAPSTSPIAGVGSWPDPLYPDNGKTGSLLGTLIRADLLSIHSSSPVTAFVWEPATFEEALREAEGDVDAIGTPRLSGSFYPTVAHYCHPCGGGAAQRNPRAPRAHMTTRAVNRFETDVQRAAADPDWELKPFAAITGHGPTAVIAWLNSQPDAWDPYLVAAAGRARELGRSGLRPRFAA